MTELEGKEYIWSPEMRKMRCEDLFARIERAAKSGSDWSTIVEENAPLASEIFTKKPTDKPKNLLIRLIKHDRYINLWRDVKNKIEKT